AAAARSRSASRFSPYAADRPSPPRLRAAAATPPPLRAVVPLGRHGWAQRHPATPGRVTLASAPTPGAG
ncbi:hypothetical protein, partial [Streptomyces anthocyanicus]|uniref:hypothetical protein n=1 Tax=Streptomyces anthocyanicus TaxID=68174 RepID=UPI0036CAAB36